MEPPKDTPEPNQPPEKPGISSTPQEESSPDSPPEAGKVQVNIVQEPEASSGKAIDFTDDTPAIEAMALNKIKNGKIVKAILLALGVCAGIILLLTAIGLQSEDVIYVNRLGQYSGYFLLPIAILTGFLAAYITAHPAGPKRKNEDLSWTLFIIAGLLLGIIPGIMLLVLYLSRRFNLYYIRSPNQTFFMGLVKAVLVLLIFIIGFIPGLILAILLTYPLTVHACELSGSKFC